jgi:hypothetical protein
VPRAGDADFRSEHIAARANELADGLGNLINRTIALVSRNPLEVAPEQGRTVVDATSLLALRADLPSATMRRSTCSTYGVRRRRSGRSSQRPTASSRQRSRGNLRRSHAPGTTARRPTWTPCSACCSTRARASLTNCSRSYRLRRNGSASRWLV